MLKILLVIFQIKRSISPSIYTRLFHSLSVSLRFTESPRTYTYMHDVLPSTASKRLLILLRITQNFFRMLLGITASSMGCIGKDGTFFSQAYWQWVIMGSIRTTFQKTWYKIILLYLGFILQPHLLLLVLHSLRSRLLLFRISCHYAWTYHCYFWEKASHSLD